MSPVIVNDTESEHNVCQVPDMFHAEQALQYIAAIAPAAWPATASPWALPPQSGATPHKALMSNTTRPTQLAYLSLLHATLSNPLRIPENDGFAPNWSAAFLEPLLHLHSVSTSSEVVTGCQAVLQELLARLRLHEGAPEDVRYHLARSALSDGRANT